METGKEVAGGEAAGGEAPGWVWQQMQRGSEVGECWERDPPAAEHRGAGRGRWSGGGKEPALPQRHRGSSKPSSFLFWARREPGTGPWARGPNPERGAAHGECRAGQPLLPLSPSPTGTAMARSSSWQAQGLTCSGATLRPQPLPPGSRRPLHKAPAQFMTYLSWCRHRAAPCCVRADGGGANSGRKMGLDFGTGHCLSLLGRMQKHVPP